MGRSAVTKKLFISRPDQSINGNPIGQSISINDNWLSVIDSYRPIDDQSPDNHKLEPKGATYPLHEREHFYFSHGLRFVKNNSLHLVLLWRQILAEADKSSNAPPTTFVRGKNWTKSFRDGPLEKWWGGGGGGGEKTEKKFMQGKMPRKKNSCKEGKEKIFM